MADRGMERPRGGGHHPSNIIRLAKLLSDEGKVSKVGSSVIRRQIEELVKVRLGGIGPISWTDVWVDQGGWGSDVWENSWASDFWDDYLGPSGRPEERIRKIRDPKVPELVFTDEELEVLAQLEIRVV
jgi:hypothetical protein